MINVDVFWGFLQGREGERERGRGRGRGGEGFYGKRTKLKLPGDMLVSIMDKRFSIERSVVLMTFYAVVEFIIRLIYAVEKQ